MTGIEIAAGYVFAWLVRKAGRVGARADAEVDRGLDSAMDRLHDLIDRKLGGDPALKRAAAEAAEGREELSERTARRLTDSLADAAEDDHEFGSTLEALLAELQKTNEAATRAGGGVVLSGTFHGPVGVQTGDHSRQEFNIGG